MAEKTTVGYLPGTDPETVALNLRYQQAQERMRSALEARQGRMFDPSMLALASGFLAPTQTGGFGESLGLAAKNLREAQAQEEKEERAIAEAQLGLAGQEIEMGRQRGRERMARELFGLSGQPSGGALPTTQGGGPLSTVFASPAAPPGFIPSMGLRTMPPNPDIEDRRNKFIAASVARGTDPADIIKELAKFDKDRFISIGTRIQDLGSGLSYETSTELKPKQVFFNQNESGTINVTPGQAAKLDELAANEDPAYYDFVNRLRRPPPRARQPGEKPAGEGAEPGKEGEPGERPATLRTVEEEAQDLNYRKERGTLSAKEQSDEAKAWFQRGSDASGMINDIRTLRGIFDPKNKYSQLLTGVFEKGDVSSQVGTLLESGLVGDAFKDAARKIATNLNLPPDAVTQFQFAVSRMADLKLKASTILAGQGTITEAERRLIAESVINITDTPKSILVKAEYLEARARFEEQRAAMLREFRDDRRDYNDFVRSAQYKKLKKDYEDSLDKIVERRLGIRLPPRETGGRDNAGAASRLPETVR
jgi:hypothetical protein